MDKIAVYMGLLVESPLWDPESLQKVGARNSEDLDSAQNLAYGAAALHGAAHFGAGGLASFPAGYVQRAALNRAGIDYRKGGDGTFGAAHPIMSGFIPIAGTVSAFNAAQRIGEKKRALLRKTDRKR